MAERPADLRFVRSFVTPEGVDLRLVLGQGSERLSAFILDMVIMGGGMIGLSIVVALVFLGMGTIIGQILGMIWLLGFFLLRTGYFIGFELGGRAATPGKRMLGLRVVARDGGPLTGAAIVTRNALRELEIFVPLSFLAYRAADSQADLWTGVAGLAWAGVFTAFPLFNRDRMRVGDLIAGTWVVRTPRRQLAPPVATEIATPVGPQFDFTTQQLDAYGEFELQTLADVLRRGDVDAMTIVAGSIRRKIGWTGDQRDDAAFLGAYYAALCAKLERGLLFGRRRADKTQAGR